VREVDSGHPALAQLAVKAVAVAQGTGKLGTVVGDRNDSRRGCTECASEARRLLVEVGTPERIQAKIFGLWKKLGHGRFASITQMSPWRSSTVK
jgi:hypothetical protein